MASRYADIHQEIASQTLPSGVKRQWAFKLRLEFCFTSTLTLKFQKHLKTCARASLKMKKYDQLDKREKSLAREMGL